MAYVTRLRVTSGDREALEDVVSEIKTAAERKGVELTGPHSRPPTDLAVPQYRRSPPGAARRKDGDGDANAIGEDDAGVTTVDSTFGTWRYTVYERELEIVGRQSFVRAVTSRAFPAAVRLEVEVDRRAGAGG
ncbi:30S ribosomal protein S10 [Halobacteriales archaeon SW_7_71_33]|nr:MAG: 30S ribosomal protein S10 [Halobacteriales archaeon SW_7_71_33]